MLEEVKLILFSPMKFFEEIEAQDISLLFKFWLIMSLVPALEYTIIIFISRLPSLLQIETIFFIPFTFFSGYIFIALAGFVGNTIFAGIIHVFAHLLGCRGFKKTLTSVTISNTPNLLFGLFILILFTLNSSFFITALPRFMTFIMGMVVLWIAVGIWSTILNIIGMSKLHGISFLKAFLIALLIPLLIFVIIAIAFSSVAYTYISGIIGLRSTGISLLDASCSNGHITITLGNKGTKVIEDKDIEVSIDEIDESQYFDFGTIQPADVSTATDTKPTGYSSGSYKAEVTYQNNIAGIMVEC